MTLWHGPLILILLALGIAIFVELTDWLAKK